MDYKEKYKEALERAEKLYEKGTITESLNYVFPELKESEDEKIRKEIVEFINRVYERQALIITDEERDNWIAWLEKLKVFAEHGDGLYYFGNNGFTYVGNPTCDNVLWLENQDEKPQGKSTTEAIKEEKVDNANKVESKFKVGDWIVSSILGIAHILDENDSNEYLLEYIDGKRKFSSIDYVNHEYDKWSIRDAKPGDILSNGEMIVIFKKFEDPLYRQHIVAYIGLDTNGNIQITDDTWTLSIDKTKPATKEQRDLLFSKMNESGYEWDANEKKLINYNNI